MVFNNLINLLLYSFLRSDRSIQKTKTRTHINGKRRFRTKPPLPPQYRRSQLGHDVHQWRFAQWKFLDWSLARSRRPEHRLIGSRSGPGWRRVGRKWYPEWQHARCRRCLESFDVERRHFSKSVSHAGEAEASDYVYPGEKWIFLTDCFI